MMQNCQLLPDGACRFCQRNGFYFLDSHADNTFPGDPYCIMN